MHWDKTGRVPKVKLVSSSGMCYPPGIKVWQYSKDIANQERSPEFLLVFHYIGLVDWIIGHVTQSSAFLPSPEVGLIWRLGWYPVAQNPNPLPTCMKPLQSKYKTFPSPSKDFLFSPPRPQLMYFFVTLDLFAFFRIRNHTVCTLVSGFFHSA